jgi:hypothetical protein
MCRKRSAGGGAVGQAKRIKECVRASFFDAVPDEVVEIILLLSIRTHGDVSLLISCCTTFRKLLRVDEVWKRVSNLCFGSRDDIIAVPLKRKSNQMWQT